MTVRTRFTLLFLVLLAIPLSAQTTFQGQITYLTSTSAYVNFGTNQGFDVGDTLVVLHKNKEVAQLRVATIASKSLSASIISKSAELREGDEVNGTTIRQISQPSAARIVDTTAPPPVSAAKMVTPKPVPPPDLPDNAFRGRVGAQYYVMLTQGQADATLNQPAATISLTGERLFGVPLSINYYSNSRYDLRKDALRGSSPQPRMNNRIYDASLRYGNDTTTFSILFGRFVLPIVGGVGTFDGASVRWKQGGIQFGVIAGAQPDWLTSGIDFSNPKFAAFVGYDKGDYTAPVQYQGSLAYAQQYFHNKLDRGFLFIQNNVSFPGSVSFYQSSNIDMHDLVNYERKISPHITDFYLSGSYRPLNWLSTSASYSAYRSIYFLSSFQGLPDSSFDKSFLHNAQLSFGIRLPAAMFVTINGSIRRNERDATNSPAVNMNYSWSNILGSDIGMYINGAMADNVYTTMQSTGIDIHTDLWQNLYVAAKGYYYRYKYLATNRPINRVTYGMDAYYRISKALFASLSYERYVESSLTMDRLYMELSYRF